MLVEKLKLDKGSSSSFLNRALRLYGARKQRKTEKEKTVFAGRRERSITGLKSKSTG